MRLEKLLIRYNVLVESLEEQIFPRFASDAQFVKEFIDFAKPNYAKNQLYVCVRLEVNKVKMTMKLIETKHIIQKLSEILPI